MSVKITILIFFASVSQLLFGQYKLNGSYEYETYSTEAGFSKFYEYDFNEDGTKDILLVGKNDKQVVWFKLNPNGKIDEIINKFFFYPVSNIKQFKTISGAETHLFTSRKRRMLGLVSFTKYGTIQLLNEIRFDSYPSEIISGDFNGDGAADALTFGNSFEGVSLVEEKGYKLSSTKLVNKGIFSELAVIDINTDGRNDFVAFNFLDHSLHFYENADSGIFNDIRKIKLDSEIDNLSEFDFNYDEYPDLIFSTEKGIEVFYGDSVFSYTNKAKLNLDGNVIGFTLCDLNNDNRSDIVALTSEGIYFSFNSDSVSFGKPFRFNIIENPTAITNVSKNVFYYSGDGNLDRIKHSSKFNSDIKLKYSIQNKSLNTFYLNGIFYLSFIDPVKSCFVIVSDFLSSNSQLQEINIQNVSADKIVTVQNNNIIDFYLVNKNQDFLEIVSLDTQTNSLEKNNTLLEGDLLTCFKDEKRNQLVFVSRKDSLVNYSEINFNDDELAEVIKTTEIPDSSQIIINREKIFLLEQETEKLIIKEHKTGEVLKSFPIEDFDNYKNLSEGIACLVINNKLNLIYNSRISEINFDVKSFEKDNLKVLSKDKLAYLDRRDKKIFLTELSEAEPKVYSFDIKLNENFNVRDFQVIETLLIFTAEDGTINIQELK